ncbi:MAG: hypothetical protein QOI66_152 [Myxococcales bacterium]|nr:hypothetical protein [Myxococcales bacterium]
MTAHHAHPASFSPILSRKARLVAGLLVGFSSGVTVHGLFFHAPDIWPSLLLGAFCFLSLGVSGLFFFASQRLSGARWSAGLRRVPEALMLLLPWAALGMLAVYFGRHALYPWTHEGAFAGDPPIAGRSRYLTETGVFSRAVLSFTIWTLAAWRLRAISLAQDRQPAANLVTHAALNRTAALFVVLFAPTFTFTVYDWILSLEPHWFSTMFAVYVFAGTFVQGIAAVTLAVVLLRRRGLLSHVVGDEQLHDLGKMLFAFSIFWGYIWVSQYLLIWYGNLPEEVPYYVKRTRGPWLFLFALNFVLNWLVPFLVLLSARAKRNVRLLAGVSVVLLVGHWLDLYVMIMPTQPVAVAPGLYAVAVAAGGAALAFLLVAANLARAPLYPENDPVLVDARAPGAIHF